MSIKRAFVDYMVGLGLGVFGTDIFIGGVTAEPDRAWWILSGGGTPIIKNHTGEKVKNYILSVYYRNTNAQDVDDQMQAFEETINAGNCTQLAGYDTIELEATTFPTDQDLDNQDRTMGLMQVTITVYQN